MQTIVNFSIKFQTDTALLYDAVTLFATALADLDLSQVKLVKCVARVFKYSRHIPDQGHQHGAPELHERQHVGARQLPDQLHEDGRHQRPHREDKV